MNPHGRAFNAGGDRARAVKRGVCEMGIRALLNLPVIAGVMVALAVIDLVTFCGCLRWLATDGITGTGLRVWRWAFHNSREG